MRGNSCGFTHIGPLRPRGKVVLRSIRTHATRGDTEETTMKIIMIFIATCAISMGAIAKGGGHSGGGQVNSSSHSVRGHTTKNGTYVAPSRATNPNDTKQDNYSQKGNVNPSTGKEGTKD